MADGAVNIRFGADVSELLAALDRMTQAQAQAFAATKDGQQQVSNLDAALRRLQAAVDPAFRSTMQLEQAQELLGAGVKAGILAEQDAISIHAKLQKALGGSNEETEKFSLSTTGARRELITLGHEALTGNFARMPGSLMVLAERAGGVTIGMMAMGAAVAAVAVVAAEAVIRQEQYAAALGRTEAILANSGSATRFSEEQLRGYVTALEEVRGVNLAAAESILASWAQISTATPQMIGDLTASLTGFAYLTGESAPQAAQTLAKALADPMRAVDQLAQHHVHLSAETLRTIEVLRAEGDTMGVAAATAAGLREAMQAAADHMTPAQKAAENLSAAWVRLKNDLTTTDTSSPVQHLSALGAAVAALAWSVRALHAVVRGFGTALDALADGSIMAVSGAFSAAAAAAATFYQACRAAQGGDVTTGLAALANIPQKMGEAWDQATDKVRSNIAAIKQAQAGAAPTSGAGTGSAQESDVQREERINALLERDLGARRELAQIGADASRVEAARNEILEKWAGYSAQEREEAGQRLDLLNEETRVLAQRRDTVTRRQNQGDTGQVQAWRDELAQKKALEDQFHQTSAADEAAYWQSKIALTEAGTKARQEVDAAYAAAHRRALQEAIAAEREAANTSVSIARVQVQAKREALQAAAAAGKITQADAVAGEEQAAAAQYAIELKALEHERDTLAQGLAARQQVEDKIRLLHEQRQAEIQHFAQQEVAAARQVAAQKEQVARIEASAADQVASIQVAAEKAGLDEQVQAGRLSEQQKLESLKRIDEATYQSTRARLEDERAAADLGGAAWAQADSAIQVLEARHAADSARLADQIAQAHKKAAEAAAAAWMQYFSPLDRAIDGSVQGIVQGTQTAGQAMARATQSWLIEELAADTKWLASKLIRNALGLASDQKSAQGGLLAWMLADKEKLSSTVTSQATRTAATQAGVAQREAVESAGDGGFFSRIARTVAGWFGAEEAKTGATVAGAVERKGVETAAATSTIAATVATSTASIGSKAADAAAGAYAATSDIPVVGPVLAPVAAAGAFTAVMAYQALASAVPSFAVGAWSLPGDMVANVHKGEMILPATFAQSLRQQVAGGAGGGAGGGGHTFNISAIDAKSFAAALKNGLGDQIVAHLQNKRRNFGA